jgi:integrase
VRPHKPWYRASKDAWFVEINGKQIRLAKGQANEKAAWDTFYRLMASGAARLPDAESLAVATVCDLFLDFSEKHHSPDTYRWYRDYLQDFCESYGTLLARHLKPLHVSRWLDGHDGWKGSRRCAVIAVKRAFNWAEAEGLLPSNPIKRVQKPPQTIRDRTLTSAEKKEILDAIKDRSFREFVVAMQETGARPSEVRRVTAENVNLEVGLWVFFEHKTALKTGRPRVIYLTPLMVELSKRLAEAHPEGPLFRGPRSKKGFTRNGVRCRFRNLRLKLPHHKGVIAYAYRHSFATDALANGVGVAQVAELLGHTSTDMVMRHYQHLRERTEHLRNAAKKATEGNHQPPAT